MLEWSASITVWGWGWQLQWWETAGATVEAEIPQVDFVLHSPFFLRNFQYGVTVPKIQLGRRFVIMHWQNNVHRDIKLINRRNIAGRSKLWPSKLFVQLTVNRSLIMLKYLRPFKSEEFSLIFTKLWIRGWALSVRSQKPSALSQNANVFLLNHW